MKCVQCAADVPAGQRWCGQCGHAVAPVCSACGFVGQAGNRFCGGCGAALEAAASVDAPQTTAAQTAATHVGRRQVAILFTDLAGFTALSSRVDAEDLHGVVQSYFDRVERIVKAFGGTVERYVGDAVMAMFGARVAHGDDALRAVRAALEIQAAMPELAASASLPLRCRVGIAAGEVVVMESRPGYAAEASIVGQSVNLAARIQAFGQPGEVLISAAVHHEVAGHVRAGALGKQHFKGIDVPIAVWRVDGLRDKAEGPRTRFVGRAAERAQLLRLIEAVQSGRGAAGVVLVGEAGIGKSRLLEELAAMAGKRGWSVQHARYVDFGLHRDAQGLHAIACGLLGLDVVRADARARQRAALRTVEAGQVPADLLPNLLELLAGEQTEASRRPFDAMDAAQREQGLRAAAAQLLAQASARAPLLLLLEDVHWAEPRELDRVAWLAAQAPAAPLLLAVTTRNFSHEFEQAWQRLGQAERLHCLDLQPLGPATMGQIAADWPHLSAAVVQACIERSGGNPLFLEQLLRHASESSAASVPASIKSLMLARMDLLGDSLCQALQAASVLGQRFELAALRTLIDDPGFTPEALIEAHLLAGSERELHFSHALIHEAAYATLLKRSVRALHLRAAAWYETRDAALRARHLDRGASPLAAAAYLDCAIDDIDAGRHSRAREGIVRGLELAQEADVRVDLMLQQGRLLHDTGQTAESIAAYRDALAAAPDDLRRARARIGLAAGMRLSDEIDGALEQLALAEPQAAGHDAELARLHYLRGSLAFPRGDIETCQREHGAALECARRAGLPRAEADAWSGLGDAAYAGGRMRSAYQALSNCMALCLRHGFGRIESANRFMVATVRIYLCEFDGALEDALESAELARRVGHQRAEIVSRLTAGWLLITLGRLDAAQHEAEAGLAVVQRLGAARFRPFLMESLARIALARGEREQAGRIADEALALAREGQLLRFIGPWLLATVALAGADAPARQAALDEGAALLAAGCVGHNYYNFYAEAIDVSAELGDAAALRHWADALEQYTHVEPNPWADFHAARARAFADALQGVPGARVQLQHLRAQAAGWKMASALARLDQALQGIP